MSQPVLTIIALLPQDATRVRDANVTVDGAVSTFRDCTNAIDSISAYLWTDTDGTQWRLDPASRVFVAAAE